MKIGQVVKVPAPPQSPRKGYTEWVLENMPKKGIVEYISPHGFVILNMLSVKTKIPIYRECFWLYELRELK